jgi:hypothetical protein
MPDPGAPREDSRSAMSELKNSLAPEIVGDGLERKNDALLSSSSGFGPPRGEPPGYAPMPDAGAPRARSAMSELKNALAPEVVGA